MSIPDVEGNVDDDTETFTLDLDEYMRTMLSQFIATNINSDRLRSQKDLAELRLAISALRKDNLQYMDSYLTQTPFPDRTKGNRRSSMFFRSPCNGKPHPTSWSKNTSSPSWHHLRQGAQSEFLRRSTVFLVVEKNGLRGKRVKFVWKRVGHNHGTGARGGVCRSLRSQCWMSRWESLLFWQQQRKRHKSKRSW